MASRRLRQLAHVVSPALTAGGDEKKPEGGASAMRVVPSRQGHQVSSDPSRTASGSAAKFMQNDAPTPTVSEQRLAGNPQKTSPGKVL